MHCSVSAETSFQSGNFRHFSFWSQKQYPALGLYLMAALGYTCTCSPVLYNYLVPTQALHVLQHSALFSFLFQTLLCLLLSITGWLFSSGVWIKHCWLWLNSRAQAWDQEGSSLWSNSQGTAGKSEHRHHKCFLILLLKEASGRFCLQTHHGQIVAWWAARI